MMRRWPWITMVLAAVAVFAPPGREIIYLGFFSNEQLSRNIWQPIAYGAAAIIVLLIALEWWIRKRRAV
jgi:hypothetical protein